MSSLMTGLLRLRVRVHLRKCIGETPKYVVIRKGEVVSESFDDS